MVMLKRPTNHSNLRRDRGVISAMLRRYLLDDEGHRYQVVDLAYRPSELLPSQTMPGGKRMVIVTR